MKLSKKTWLIIAAVVFIVALAGVGKVYFEQVSERDKLNDQLALTQTRLQGVQLEELSLKKTELEEQLSQATSQLASGNAIPPQSLGDVAVSGTLFALAKAYSLEVTEMSFTTPSNETVEGTAWLVTSVTVSLKGDAPSLVGFALQLNSYFPTGVIKSVTMTVPEADSEERASAEIRMSVYAPQGS